MSCKDVVVLIVLWLCVGVALAGDTPPRNAEEGANASKEGLALIRTWLALAEEPPYTTYRFKKKEWLAESVEAALAGKWEENPYEGLQEGLVYTHRGLLWFHREQQRSKKWWRSERKHQTAGGAFLVSGAGTGHELRTVLAGNGFALGTTVRKDAPQYAWANSWRLARADGWRWAMTEWRDDPMQIGTIAHSIVKLVQHILEHGELTAEPVHTANGHQWRVVNMALKQEFRGRDWEEHLRMVFDVCCPGPPREVERVGGVDGRRNQSWVRVEQVTGLDSGIAVPTRVVWIWTTRGIEPDHPLAGKVRVAVREFTEIGTAPPDPSVFAVTLEQGVIVRCDHEPPHSIVVAKKRVVRPEDLGKLAQEICGSAPPGAGPSVAAASVPPISDTALEKSENPRTRSLRWFALALAALAAAWLLIAWYRSRLAADT